MKPLLIELQAFGPFAGYEQVDFTLLSRDGPFLIAGETGAGKTTILDAMTFALYEMSSGHHRDSLEAMRCRQAPWGTDTFVAFTFEISGEVYRFERRLVCKRVNLDPKCSVTRQRADGVFEPLFENCRARDANDKAKALIGLDYEQFRQVVILPQGQFEKFLTSRVEEKEAILSRIFGIRKWSAIAEAFFQLAKAQRDKSDALRRELDVLLQAEGCDSLDALADKTAACAEALQKEEADYAAADYPAQKQALNAQLELGRAFDALHSHQAAGEALSRKAEEHAGRVSRLRDADRAEALRTPMEALDRAGAGVRQRERAQETTAENLSTARTAAEGAEKVRAAHEAGAAADAARSETLILYKSKRAAYASLAVPVQALEAAQTALDIAEQARDSAQKTAEQKRDAVKEAYDALTDGEAILSDARARYMAGICGELAGTLHDGEACPVCGSPTHPHPAQRDLESVSRAQLDVLEQAAQAARESWSTADRARETAETALRGKDAQYHAAKAEAERARHALETAQAALIPGIADAEALEAAITELETAQSRYQNRLNLLTEQAQQAAEQLARREEQFQTAAGELAAAAETQREAERLCLAALEAHGFPDVEAARAALLPQETRNTLRDEIGRYETLLEENTRAVTEAQAALAGKEEPDREAVKDKLDAVEAEMLAYRERHTTLSDRAAHLTERLKTVGEKQRRYDAERGQVESDYAFARSLRGDTGVGLQRYVLGVMFSSVIGAANRMLEHVHGGRYRLYRSDARGEGNKRGLELYIHDNRAPEDAGRSVGTLSGGEKFLVSLALSIGLSSVAQRSGIRLGTLFIDEGFGSLDDQSIDDALSVIGSIQRASGTVGIISHVGILYDTLSAKVEVSKSDTGSHIVQAVG